MPHDVLRDLIYCKEKAMVIDYLDEVMGTKPQGDIQITRDYPFGWHATVPADNFALLIGCKDGRLRLLYTAPCLGFYPNGNMRLRGIDEAYYELREFYEDDDECARCYWSPLNCAGNACNSTGANCVMCNVVLERS